VNIRPTLPYPMPYSETDVLLQKINNGNVSIYMLERFVYIYLSKINEIMWMLIDFKTQPSYNDAPGKEFNVEKEVVRSLPAQI